MRVKKFLADILAFFFKRPTPRRHKRLYSKQRKRKLPDLIAKYGMKCFWCGCELTDETMTVDHYIPLSKGGDNRIKNLRLACVSCNNGRGDAMPKDALNLINRQNRRINVPDKWKGLKYRLGQKTVHGEVIGFIYHPPGSKRASESGERWSYFVLENSQSDEIETYFEDEIGIIPKEQVNYAKL